MKSKHLLLLLLMALLVPWAAMAQDPSCTPSFGDPSDDYISKFVTVGGTTNINNSSTYETDGYSNYYATLSASIAAGETLSCTITPSTTSYDYGNAIWVDWNQNNVFDDNERVAYSSVMSGAWTGGIVVSSTTTPGDYYMRIMHSYNAAATNPCVSASYGEAEDYKLVVLPAACCPMPTDLTCTGHTATTATFTWTNGGEETQWQLEYAMDENFTNPTQVTVNQSDLVNGEYTLDNNLTAEQQYYARIKAWCPNCGAAGEYSNASNTCPFKPSAAIEFPALYAQGGSNTQQYIPIYGYYCDVTGTESQFIIPASALTNIAGSTIKKLVFYCSSNRTFGKIEVKLEEVEETSFASATLHTWGESAVQVYNNTLSIENNEMVVEFSTPFVYEGGNLMIGTKVSTTASDTRTYWYGENQTTNTAICNKSSLTCYKFLPKTTFFYIPNPTPKPKNLQYSNVTATAATLSWEEPNIAPTKYAYQYKAGTGDYNALTETTGLSVNLSLTASTTYTFRVKAIYDGVGDSDFVETTFTTLDACAFPTNFVATTTPGQGTKATFTWTKGYDEDAWVLQYATNDAFTEGLVEVTTGFTVEGNNVTANLNGLTAETKYYARVKANCGGPTSSWSNVAEFTPTNYVDYTYNNTASSTSSYVPFYYYTTYSTNQSQFIIPAASLADVAGGQIRSITYYTSSTATLDFGGAEFDVYMAEVEQASFSSATFVDWTTLGTPVYSGTVSLANSKMTITFGDDFSYNGGNLLIGFKVKTTGSNSTSFSWTVVYNSSSYTQMYQYSSNSAQRTYYQPKVTLNYRPTVTPRPIITEPVATTDVTATIAWTKPSDNVTGYKYQYKLTSATEWPTAWTSLNDANAVSVTVPNLTPNSNYDFRMKAVYAADESFISTTSFATTCPAATAVPYTYDFETAPKFNCWTVATGSSVTRYNYSDYAHLGSYYLRFEGTQENVIEMPSFEQATNTLRLEYWVRPESYTNSDCGSLAIGYYNASNEFVALKTYAYNTATSTYDGWEGNTYKKDKIDFDVAGVPADANIIFRQFGTTSNWYWFVDDVKVKLIPTCEDVDNVHVVDYTNHSANIAWTADAGQSAWQIAYKAGANFNPNDATELATATIVDATANPYLFDMTLEADATYYMYVRANCTASSDGYGDWSDSYATFTTFEATPAPSSFTASNLASQQVDLKWVEGGGDGETSWDLYYVKSTTAPTPPTASTPATETVTTMPTPADPYVLKNLDPESTYYIWVRSNYDWNSTTSHSDWVALTGDSFTTLNNCPTPNNVEIDANSITAVEAIVTWVGSMDVSSYTVEYGEEGTYSVNETVDFSGLTTAGYSSEGVLPDGWKRYNSNAGYMPHVSNKASCGDIDEFGDDNNYLLMTQNKSSNQYLYAIMPQISNLASLEFKYVYESTGTGVLSVGYVTDNTGYSTYQVLQTPTKSGTVQTFKLNATDIATINANNGYVTFRYEGTSTTYYSVGIDDIVYKGGTYTPGLIETKPATEQQITLTGLTPNKTYNVRVKSDCTSAEWSTYASFTTLPDGTKVFKTTGEWGTAANWSPSGAPALTDDVILRADATIENGCVATANSIAPSGNTLAIADGGQLQTNTAVTATVKKNITGYGDAGVGTNNGYYLIANPINTSIGNATTYGMATSDGLYDLYQFNANPSASDSLEWRNYKASSFSIANGKGYLYANKNNVELTFTGNVRANNAAVGFGATSTGGWQFKGWNLFGNPFVCDAYLVDAETGGSALPYYKMNSAGNNVESVSGGAIAPMEGIFYEASAATNVYFTRTNPAVTSTGPKGNLNILVSNSNTRGSSVIDNAIISFGNPNTLGKLNLFACDARVFIPQDGKDYAVACAESNVGEMPLNFKAEKNGAYTLSFTAEEVGFSYLHLIDNMTGADIDLLAGASTGSATYTFNAKTTDYASRFRLVFATGSSVEDDNFGFINGSGNLCIFGIEGTATLQVIDVTGRILSSETFSGSYEKRLNAAPGVYVMRLINGNEVKTQKIVVR